MSDCHINLSVSQTIHILISCLPVINFAKKDILHSKTLSAAFIERNQESSKILSVTACTNPAVRIELGWAWEELRIHMDEVARLADRGLAS